VPCLIDHGFEPFVVIRERLGQREQTADGLLRAREPDLNAPGFDRHPSGNPASLADITATGTMARIREMRA
jgi:hypothetical protein